MTDAVGVVITDNGRTLNRHEPSLAGPVIRTGGAVYEDGEWLCWRLAGDYVTGQKRTATMSTKQDAVAWLEKP